MVVMNIICRSDGYGDYFARTTQLDDSKMIFKAAILDIPIFEQSSQVTRKEVPDAVDVTR